MSDFTTEAREALGQKGLSIRAAARAVNYDHAFLSRVLNGKQGPSRQLVEALDNLLDKGGHLVALAPAQAPVPTLRQFRPDADMYSRIASVLNEPSKVDHPAVDWLEHSLGEHRRAEDETGGAPLLAIIKSQLVTVNDLGKHAREGVRDRLVSLASQYAQFMAWLCNDTGDKAGAVAWYDRAHDWALEAGDPNMAATTLSMKAHIAWSVNDGHRTLRLGEAARWHGGRVSSGIEGMAAQMTARGNALLGDEDTARRVLDEAQTLVTKASEHPENEPDWMYFYGDDWFTAQRGMIELDLNNGKPAVEYLTTALSRLPENYRRDRAWFSACLAKAHALADDLDAATLVSTDTADDALAVNGYAVEQLRGVAVKVAQKLPRAGQDLLHMLRDIG